jgi:endonuclease/exonuclease/phosphatase family metal-dependent hydrolase
MRFVAVNSFDGTKDRRDGFLLVVKNFGGDLLPDQMNWISGQLGGQSNAIPFMHHNPLGPYYPNAPFSMETMGTIITNWILGGGDPNAEGHRWNSQATGEWLRDQLVGKSPFALFGHEHKDLEEAYAGTHYIETTSMSDGGSTPWGYRRMNVQNGVITQWSYTSPPATGSTPTGNLAIHWLTPNDGTSKYLKARLVCGLAEPLGLVLEGYIKADPAGYAVSNGTLLAQRALPNNVTKVWIQAPSPTSADLFNPSEAIVTITGNSPPAAAPSASCGSPPTGSIQSGDTRPLFFCLLSLSLGLWIVLLLRLRPAVRKREGFRWMGILCMAFLMGCPVANPGPALPTEIRVVTYNTQHFGNHDTAHPDGKKASLVVADVKQLTAAWGVAIWLFQEVYQSLSPNVNSYSTDHVGRLLEALPGYAAHFYPYVTAEGKYAKGTAILWNASKFDAVGPPLGLVFQETGTDSTKGAAGRVLRRISDSKEFLVVCVHLAASGLTLPRKKQAIEAVQYFAEAVAQNASLISPPPNQLPWILGGDLNTVWRTAEGAYKYLTKQAGFVPSSGSTAMSHKSGLRLDHILTKGMTDLGGKVCYSATHSDHYPVLARLKVP